MSEQRFHPCRRGPGPRGHQAALLAALVVVVTACGGETGGSEPRDRDGAGHVKRGGTLKVLYRADVDSIDPGITYYSGGYLVSSATQRPLVNFAPREPQRPVPDLAAGPPEVAADGTAVKVRIRPGVRFSPPVDREVTSKDVKYAVERGFFKTVNNGYVATYFGDIVGAKAAAPPGREIPGIRTPDDHTIVFELSRASGGSLSRALALPISAPVPREYAGRYDRQRTSTYGRHVVATGPYMVANDREGDATGYRPGRSIRLVRNPNWDARTDYKPAHLDEIDIAEGNEDTAVAARRILAGSHMVSGEFQAPAPVIARASKEARAQLALVPIGGVEYIPLNTAIEPFDDINVRRAVVAGFNREAMRLAFGGAIRGPLATHFIPPGIPGFGEAGGLKGPGFDYLAKSTGDPELAAAYFRKAGHASGRYEGDEPLLVVAINDPDIRRQAEVAQRNLEQLGFRVRLRSVTSDAFYTRFCTVPRAEVHACVGWVWFRDFPDPQTILDATFNGDSIQPQNNVNAPQLDHPPINRAIRRARTLVEPGERAAAWAAIDRDVTAQAPAIPGTWPRQPIVRSKDVNGVANPNIAGWDFTFTSLR